MHTKREIAKNYFHMGYNCAQSVLLAFHSELALTEVQAAKMAAGFGAGIGRLREVCGAVCGMVLTMNLFGGSADPGDNAAKAAYYADIQAAAKTFEAQNGSIICRELLGLTHRRDDPQPEARTPEYYKKRPCEEMVGEAAAIAEDWLKARGYL